MEFLADSAHGDASNPATPFSQKGCESCHGPGSFHVTRSRRGKGRPPMIMFGEDTNTPRQTQIAVCMGCHDANAEAVLEIPGHASAAEAAEFMALSCSSCHTIHQVPADLTDELAAEAAALAARLTQPPEYTTHGTQQCLLCHVERRFHAMSDSIHGDASNPDTPYSLQGCESCHGKGSLHVTAPLSGETRPVMIRFGENAATPAREQNQVCLGCHRIKWEKSVHANDGLICSNCHNLHTNINILQDRQGQSESCFTCHREQESTHPRFRAQSIQFDELKCSACHNAHELIPQHETGHIVPPDMVVK
jgi:hypothetical protein